jgi:hypothetical protein
MCRYLVKADYAKSDTTDYVLIRRAEPQCGAAEARRFANPLGVFVTWYGKKRVLIPTVLLGTSLLAGCGPDTADDGPAAANKLAAAAAPGAAQNKGAQEAAAKAAAQKEAEAAAQQAAADKAAADKAAAQQAAADKAAADKAAAQQAAADKAAADKAAAQQAAADKAAAQKAAETAAAQNAAPVAAGATEYTNCTDLRVDYPHGVGRPGATDTTTGSPVTEFTVNRAVYDANTKSDRDDDGIACEKH